VAFSLKEQIAIICQGKELEQVETFKYLGSVITENGDTAVRRSRRDWEQQEEQWDP